MHFNAFKATFNLNKKMMALMEVMKELQALKALISSVV